MYKALKYFHLTYNGNSVFKMEEDDIKDLSFLDYHTLNGLLNDGFIEKVEGVSAE
jgi:hypothetical protein